MVRLIGSGVYLVKGTKVLQPQGSQVPDALQGHRVETEELGINPASLDPAAARKNTISYHILSAHNVANDSSTSNARETLKIRFDALASHDITYVGIVQTARASGLKEFPLPYVLTNCHNSLGAVGGTINEDDHVFGLSAAQKYGGIYVPAHQAVIHQYMREMMARCGSMILGSDSHTRYGALGTMAVGEGGPELVKQLLEKTYDISYPEIVGVYLTGKPQPGVGPQDVALALIAAVFKNGFVKNKVLEFVGPGIANLSMDYRNGIDTMTTETTCLSSIWLTDEKVKEYFRIHGRPEGYARLEPGEVAYYDGMVVIDMEKVEPMIALPFHPSNAYPISELNRNAHEILAAVEEEGLRQLDNPALRFSLPDHLVGGRLTVDQAVVAGCAGGTFENLVQVADIVDHHTIGNGALSFSVYPASQPVYLQLVENGAAAKMLRAGVTVKTAFCGPCFGAGDVPANGSLSIRHTTRNFPNREGSKPGEGQIASVALMDARSIAATAINGGRLTPATELGLPAPVEPEPYEFEREIYAHRVYQGFTSPQPEHELRFGPNIADWPRMSPLPENLLLQVAAVLHDPVTTTDELIPSGETSSYRSNPLKLAEFTLSRKDPGYVGRAKRVKALELERRQFVAGRVAAGQAPVGQAPVGQVISSETVAKKMVNDEVVSGQDVLDPDVTGQVRVEVTAGKVATGKPSEARISDNLREVCLKVLENCSTSFSDLSSLLASTGIGTTIYAIKPGDGSAREQAASCQKVLGGWANIAGEYATKRYRSNLINWGMLPFTVDSAVGLTLKVDDFIFIPDIRDRVSRGEEVIPAELISSTGVKPIELWLRNLTTDEREIILKGCLINYYVGE
ncbi:2,3-dimethylmalate dehydratase large subunit [Peptococcaceae bacterium CEB3]|nr:2,3-dimethylmalate dehydratase large subunit [Peptococcaceae bacterium CEB3]